MRKYVWLALLLACSGKPSTQPPAAPQNVKALAGDGQATVLWDAVDGALGYRVYSALGAPDRTAAHQDVGAVGSWTVVGLTNGQGYQFAVSALGTGGESALSVAAQATPQSNVPIAVASVTPADAAQGVARNAKVVVRFNRPAQGVTAGCAGSLQVSDDAFAHCAGGAVASNDGGLTWTFTPSAPLHGGATYKVRVTAAVTDALGRALAAPFTSKGFATAAALAVTVTTSGPALQPAIALAFNRAIAPATLTSGQGCSGSVRLAAGGACVALAQTVSGNTATFTPAAPLQPGTTYTLTVGTALTDADGVPLDAEVTASVATPGALDVVSTAPADGAVHTAATSMTITFDRALDASSVQAACGSFAVYAGASATCDATTTATVSGATAQVSVRGGFAQSTKYAVTIANLRARDGGSLLAPVTVRFVTGPALAVIGATPSDGSTNVSLQPTLSVSFNAAASGVSAITSGTACGASTLQLRDAAGNCVAMQAAPAGSADAKTWTVKPAAPLAASSTYRLAVLAAVTDASGLPMQGDFVQASGFTTGAAVDTTPPGNPTSLAAAMKLQGAALTWTAPGDADLASFNVYVAPAGGAFVKAGTATAPSFIATGLAPFTAWDFKVTSVDASGNESSGTTLAAQTTAFTGTADDWTAAQTVTGENGNLVRFTWTAAGLFVGISQADGTRLLDPSNPDVLWVAAGTSGNGSNTVSTAGVNDLQLPFATDAIAELTPKGVQSVVHAVDPATGVAGATIDGAANYDGAVQEVMVPASFFGASTGTFRFAVFALNRSTGNVFEIAPRATAATNVLGYFASAAVGYDASSSIFQGGGANSVAAVSTVNAPNLVTFQVDKKGVTGPVLIAGSLHPLSYTLANSLYQLRDNGAGVLVGIFNIPSIGGAQLYFQLVDNGTPEFRQYVDRVTSLPPGASTLPVLTFNQAWSATHTVTLDVACASAQAGTQLFGSVSPLSWSSGASMTLTSSSTALTSVSFTNQDFTATPLEMKCAAPGGNWEPNSNHSWDDDIIGTAAALWTWGDSTGF